MLHGSSPRQTSYDGTSGLGTVGDDSFGRILSENIPLHPASGTSTWSRSELKIDSAYALETGKYRSNPSLITSVGPRPDTLNHALGRAIVPIRRESLTQAAGCRL